MTEWETGVLKWSPLNLNPVTVASPPSSSLRDFRSHSDPSSSFSHFHSLSLSSRARPAEFVIYPTCPEREFPRPPRVEVNRLESMHLLMSRLGVISVFDRSRVAVEEHPFPRPVTRTLHLLPCTPLDTCTPFVVDL